MKKIMLSILLFMLIGCASTKELSAPCTYDKRSGCGTLIYSHESL